MKTFLLSIINLSSLSAIAETGTKDINCGDHWFAVDVALEGASPVVTLSGDSITGEDPVYKADASTVTSGGVSVWSFSFGDESEKQTLQVTFHGDESYGSGVYRSSPGGFDINMNCLRR